MTDKSKKETAKELTDSSISERETTETETDQEIISKINKRKEENQALKKILENLNSTLPANKKSKKV